MGMSFYGDWLVSVAQKNAAFSQRFRIAGSTGSDGIYAGVPGTGVVVSGDAWDVSLEWNDNAGSGWQPSNIRKLASFTLADGLVITLGADDNTLSAPDFDFNDLIVQLKCLDPAVNELSPPGNPYDFSIPRDMLRDPPCEPDPKHDPRHEPDGDHPTGRKPPKRNPKYSSARSRD